MQKLISGDSMAGIDKTNAMRILDQSKIPYTVHTYPHDGCAIDGVRVAELLGQDPECVFKTLVTRGASNQIYVFVIPVRSELHLKKAAKAVGEKSISMIRVSEITPLTGYVRGGCSPIGMKKAYPTTFDEQIEIIPHIIVSGGKIGLQIQLNPEDLLVASNGKICEIT